VSGVRTPAPAYNNALSYQPSYAHGTTIYFLWMLLVNFRKTKLIAHLVRKMLISQQDLLTPNQTSENSLDTS
jgi:hypothetical protein